MADCYARCSGVVWRQAPDRVLLRRIGDRSDRAQRDLEGAAALIWIALDAPRTLQQVADELVELGVGVDAEHLATAADALVQSGWLAREGPR